MHIFLFWKDKPLAEKTKNPIEGLELWESR